MKRRSLTTLLIVIVLVLLVLIGYTAYNRGSFLNPSNRVVKDSGGNISDYSAVFLTNGQVYFGKIYGDTNSQTLDLKDIYYLQVNQQIQPNQGSPTPSPSATPNVVLVKLGDELHGPADHMVINQSQIIFTESLKSDSKVVQAINNYVSSKK